MEKTDEGATQANTQEVYGDQVMQILDTLQYDASEQSGVIGVYDEDASNDTIGAQALVRKVSKTAATVEFM